jgi:hypothetical protein
MPIVLVLFDVGRTDPTTIKVSGLPTYQSPTRVLLIACKLRLEGIVAKEPRPALSLRPLAPLDQGQIRTPRPRQGDRGVKLVLENAPSVLLAGSAWFRWTRGGPDHLAGLGWRRAIGTFCPRGGPESQAASTHGRLHVCPGSLDQSRPSAAALETANFLG